MRDRYWVDVRTGCCAVRDRTIWQDGNCCNPEQLDVVKYWSGKPVQVVCETCGHTSSKYALQPEILQEAQDLCNELNNAERK